MIKEKVEEYAKKHWPGVEQLGDALRAMVVCRAGRESGDLIYRTWKQLEQAFDIRKGHGRLKNNYATAGMPNDDPKVFAKNQKPPDMLMNAVLDVEGCMSMPAEIQVHHEEILDLKESKVHLLYEIARAKSIGILRGGAPVPIDEREVQKASQPGSAIEKEMEHLKETHAKELEHKNRQLAELARQLQALSAPPQVPAEAGLSSTTTSTPPLPGGTSEPGEGDSVIINNRGRCKVLKRMGMRLRVETEAGRSVWAEVKDVVEVLR